MKKLVYRNINGTNPRKREISIEEITGPRNTKVTKKWICKYFVKEQYSSKDVEELEKWIRVKKESGTKNDCHIIRELNGQTGENKIVCKVLGEFFAVSGKNAYKIMYVNEVKIDIQAEAGYLKRRH